MTTSARLTIWGGSILLVILIIWAMIALVTSGGKPPTAGELSIPVSSSDWSRGGATSSVTLVEYSDFQCPACRGYHPMIEQLIKERPDKFLFVYRHFPLITLHRNADMAAQAAEAAGKQNHFWEMYNKLFDTQLEWENDADVLVKFTQYAKEMGLDIAKFESDFNDRAIRVKINDSYKGGVESGVPGTPTFFLNGKLIETPRDYAELVKVIDTAASASTTPQISITNATSTSK